MGRRKVVRPQGGYSLPQVEIGLRIAISGLLDRIPTFGADVLRALDTGEPFGLTTAKVDDALLRSGDENTWRQWRKEHPSGDAWQEGGEGAVWIYDPRTAFLTRQETP